MNFCKYGIQLINEWCFRETGRCFTQALRKQSQTAHIYFAAALVDSLTNGSGGTYK